MRVGRSNRGVGSREPDVKQQVWRDPQQLRTQVPSQANVPALSLSFGSRLLCVRYLYLGTAQMRFDTGE